MRKTVFLPLAILLLALTSHTVAASENIFDLRDFGAVGDGEVDDGPALQRALDALAEAGGGTLLVPQGRYAILTPVAKDFSGTASSVSIMGVESSAVIDNTGQGMVLAQGLDLVSEFAPMTGASEVALSISGLQHFLIQNIGFIGTPEIQTDAKITLRFDDVADAIIRHCEFYGLMSAEPGGAIVLASQSKLTIDLSKFLGSTGNSAFNVPVVENIRWKGIAVTNSTFLDYGLRPELYGKTGMGTPLSWINVGGAEPVTADSPRRECVFDNVFLDEGALAGVFVIPQLYQPDSAPIDLVYISGLRMNVSNVNWWGNYFFGVNDVLIEKSRYEWSHNADAAININGAGTAILDGLECLVNANRIRADATTQDLFVINSLYDFLDSDAQNTQVLTTETPADDPVQYVRQQFEVQLNRSPDPAAHFYWSARLLRCGEDTECETAVRADLAAFLSNAPAANFSLSGRVTDENGGAINQATVSLTGSQTVATQTGTDGRYAFVDLPSSGVYEVTSSKAGHAFNHASLEFTTPAGDQVADFTGTANKYRIAGRIADADGTGIAGINLALTGGMTALVTTDANGDFEFPDLSPFERYTVTPTLEDYTFQPSIWTIDELTEDQSGSIIAIHDTHAIQGRVTKSDGSSIAGVTITLSGTNVDATTTDAGGNYSFVGLHAGGNYIVAVSKANYSFTPASRVVNDLSATTTVNFTGALVNYTLSGRVTSGGVGLGNVVVGLTGSKNAAATTDGGGNYSFSVSAEGNYTITPSLPHYSFTPASGSFTALNANQSRDFSATLSQHSISGRVAKSDGSALSGATVTLSGSQAATSTTNGTGDYSFPSLTGGGTFTVTVTKSHYTLQPSGRTFVDLSANQTATFSGTLNSHAITGRVTGAAGSGLSGVTVTLSGAQAATASTNANGDYSFSGIPAGGNYTIALSRANYSFTPANRTWNDLGANQTANFTGELVNYKISGAVTFNGVPLPAVAFTINGSENATMTATDGSYSHLAPAEGSYTITPYSTRYLFTPASVTVTILSANSVSNFTAALKPGVPILVSQASSTRALAFDSLLQVPEPFQLTYSPAWSADARTRVMLFAMNFDLAANEDAGSITADGEDGVHLIYPLTVEYIGKVSGYDWLKCVVLRLDDSMGNVGDILVRITYRGVASNRVRIGIGHIGGGLQDDPDAIPTPGAP
ncbi:MAG: large repetitive protein [Blastocatellia bacterium]|jgi:hypothetical protein|nr:large repetitive protein [Blastocatellia bacterium]